MNEDANGKKKLFWKEESSVKGGNLESCRRSMEVGGGHMGGRSVKDL